MYSQRYGTPPIVHATGGLVDSVVDCTPHSLAAGTASGLKFFAPTPEALTSAIARCVAAYRDPAVWRALQRNGMARDFGWNAAAQEYAALYDDLCRAGVPPLRAELQASVATGFISFLRLECAPSSRGVSIRSVHLAKALVGPRQRSSPTLRNSFASVFSVARFLNRSAWSRRFPSSAGGKFSIAP
jgi:hypothetical protein